ARMLSRREDDTSVLSSFFVFGNSRSKIDVTASRVHLRPARKFNLSSTFRTSVPSESSAVRASISLFMAFFVCRIVKDARDFSDSAALSVFSQTTRVMQMRYEWLMLPSWPVEKSR